MTLDESAGKLLTTANATTEIVLPKEVNASNVAVISTTHGSKKLKLNSTDTYH